MTDPHPRNPAGTRGDASYRAQLLQRVESLLSVLEVAHSRLEAHLARPGADPERQQKTLDSLAGTIRICQRARRALRREVDWEAARLDDAPVLGPAATAASSFAEYLRFRELGPLTSDEVATADIDALCERFAGEEA